MKRKDSSLKKSVLHKAKSLQKNIGLKSSKLIINPQQNLPTFTKTQKKLIQTQAKEVKNKIGKFLSKLKSKADGILKQTQQYGLIMPQQNNIQDSSLIPDPYQFRKNNPILLEKGCKKNQKPKATQLSNQYYNQKEIVPNNNYNLQTLHPMTKYIKDFDQTVTTTSSDNNISKDIKLKDFIIGKQLGAGKYGQVFLAIHKKSGMIFALKKINRKQVDETMMKQISHEIKIQIFIDHPNLVKLYTFFHQQNCLYLVLQLSTSGHLYDYLKKKIFIQQETTRNIVKQILAGLCHLHKHNIIHRDVKLQNILYQMGMVKICDFGWSIETQDLRQTFCGTPLYIAPQILLQKGYDKKIDIWCVGILTFQLLYGRVPFQIRYQKDFMKIIYEQVTFPSQPTISKTARNFIIQCLIKDPDVRPNFAQLLTHPFLEKCDNFKTNQLF